MMNNLQVKNTNGVLTLDSREVARMIDKRHDHLLRDIQGYIEVLNQTPTLGTDTFFIESEYLSGTGKSYKCYLLTKKGCDMVANKMTGEKGVLFSAAYINQFYEMEQQLQQQSPIKVPKSYKEALLQLVEAEEEREKLLLEKEKKLVIRKN